MLHWPLDWRTGAGAIPSPHARSSNFCERKGAPMKRESSLPSTSLESLCKALPREAMVPLQAGLVLDVRNSTPKRGFPSQRYLLCSGFGRARGHQSHRAEMAQPCSSSQQPGFQSMSCGAAALWPLILEK
jgi:hypothetical protein